MHSRPTNAHDIIECACGCGKTREAGYHWKRGPQRYIAGHNGRKPKPLCENCGQPRPHGSQKFCSRRCAGQARRARTLLTCRVCGKEYEQHVYREESSLYCSKKCWNNRALTATCPNCGKTFKQEGKARPKVYCGQACRVQHMVGPRAVAWKDGSSLKNERARHGNDLKRWRTAVYQRDGYRCVRCGARKYIQAHHIKPFAKYPDLRFDVANGETLCTACHSKEHGRDLGPFVQRKPKCVDCGIRISGKGKTGRCRKCASRESHRKKRLASLGDRSTGKDAQQ